ncbi:MAG: DinB family protein [Candidatus Cyclobacteriaceae bacterium M3_2C_046]
MKTTSEHLIADLIERTRQNLNNAQNLKLLKPEQLNWKVDHSSWSILECIEHLNLYGDFYLPEIGKQIQSSHYKSAEEYKSGWLGIFFANSLLPKDKLNKMKTFKDKDPLGSALDSQTLDRFIDQQKQTVHLLNQARQVHLMKTKTAISITKWIKLQLGDTFRVLIYHNQRHLVQAEKVRKLYQERSHTQPQPASS